MSFQQGDIQEYLSKLLEINGRVGAKGEPLREVITAAMTPEMHRAIYQRYRRLPVDDKELIGDRKSTRLNSSHRIASRMPSSA